MNVETPWQLPETRLAARIDLSGLPAVDWAPSEAGQVMLLSGYDADDATLRGRVVYPAAFDGLE